MYARSTTVQAQPDAIDAGIAQVRDEVMPALQAMDGCVGISLLVDRESGRCIATTAWETEEAMHESAERAASLRARAAEAFGGNATAEEWEIAVLHRDHRTHEGACVRVTWAQLEPSQIDGGIEHYKTSVLSAMEDLDGFCSASLMVDRASGRGVSSASFDSREAMERSKEKADALKTSSMREVGAEEVNECEFELALAHLRVPELA
ncbi:antibiotic biosynthesis monooxygenase [Mycobacterium sp. 48b]|uniref:antibiotic biosynthesis monooxygenase n=1 Tax=Mycobacterium sp. 48b TaxID=3400426 RepID=UPI003AAFC79F